MSSDALHQVNDVNENDSNLNLLSLPFPASWAGSPAPIRLADPLLNLCAASMQSLCSPPPSSSYFLVVAPPQSAISNSLMQSAVWWWKRKDRLPRSEERERRRAWSAKRLVFVRREKKHCWEHPVIYYCYQRFVELNMSKNCSPKPNMECVRVSNAIIFILILSIVQKQKITDFFSVW